MKTIWFHTASVGEFNTAKPLLKKLIKDYRIVLTYFSPRAKDYIKRYPEYYHSLERLPLDTPFTVRSFEKKIQAHAILIMEREFWPSFILFTKAKKVLLNAYAKGGIYERFISRKFDLIITKSDRDRERYESYGCKKVVSCGNLKFLFEERQIKEMKKGDFKLFVAGSTHNGEEKILIEAFGELKKRHPDLRLLIAPRHISRSQEIANKVKGFRCFLRSRQEGKEWDILILDTLGELFDVYALADAAFVGGTLVPVGGHNLLEPAYHGKPVLFGPFTQKVRDMAEYLLQEGAGFVVSRAEDIIRVVDGILSKRISYNRVDISQESERIMSCYFSNIKDVL